MGEHVVHRERLELGVDRLGLVGARGLHGLQVGQDRRVGAGLDHVRHAAGALHVALPESPGLVVGVPVPALGERQALRHLEPEPVHLREGEQQRRELLAAFDDAVLGRLLDRVGGVEAGIGEPDHLGLRALRLEQERGEVLVRERVADAAQHLAVIGEHHAAGIGLEGRAEGVVGGEEVPGVAPGPGQRAAGADRERPRVVGPVVAVGRAGLAGEVAGSRPGGDRDLLLLLGQALDRQSHGGGGQLHDRVDAVAVVPLPRDGRGDVGLVLVVGREDLDRDAVDLAAHILHRHLRGLDGALAAELRIEAGLVVEHADAQGIAGESAGRGTLGGGRARAQHRARQGGGQHRTANSSDHVTPRHVLPG